jgi:hypothetical protein
MMLALSPDGSRLAYLAPEDNTRKIWIRNMDEAAGASLREQKNPLFPFWSPDGKSIGFFSNTQLKRVDIAGGPPLPLATIDNGRGGTWNRDNVIPLCPQFEWTVVSSFGKPAAPNPRRSRS